jgi:hypothetical protein
MEVGRRRRRRSSMAVRTVILDSVVANLDLMVVSSIDTCDG